MKLLSFLIMISVSAFASSIGQADMDIGATDIVQRLVNFLIFAGIVYYLLAEPLKEYFNGRTQGIADELEKVQQKVLENKEAKKMAEQKIKDAEKFASELMESSKKENKLISEKIMQQCEVDLEIMQKQHEALMALEQRTMVRDNVEQIVGNILGKDSDLLDQNEIAKIIMKKVA